MPVRTGTKHREYAQMDKAIMLTASFSPISHRLICWAMALSGLAALPGCGTAPPTATPASSTPAHTADGPTTNRSVQSAQLGRDVALYAMSMLDRDYRWGGRQPTQGFDCSGLIAHVYKEAIGVRLHGNAAALARQSRDIHSSTLQAGDLLFFNTLGQPYSHVALYVGNGRFVHAANERKGVRMDKLSNRYYATRFEGAKTVLE